MRYLKGIAVFLMLALALAAAGPVSAQSAPISDGYVVIRSGPIEAYEWDRPKVVVEFGNLSASPIEVALACSVSDTQVARIVQAPNSGPFPTAWIAPDKSLVRYFDSPQSASYPAPPFVNGISIPAHSHYRVALRLRIYSEDGSDGSLTCMAYRSNGNHPIVYGQVSTPITVH